MISRFLRPALLAVSLVSLAPFANAAPAPGRPAAVSFATFRDSLASFGTWKHDVRWGDVWHPNGAGFRPYFDRGHWVFASDYGWTWASDDPWGDIVFHYGRWVCDPSQGWLWIPGYVWGPGWVDWRLGNGEVGWMPAPPDPAFLAGEGMGFAVADWGRAFYGYRNWYGGKIGASDVWAFVDAGHFADPDFKRYALPRAQSANLILRTRDVTEYRAMHDLVVNRSFGLREIRRYAPQRIPVVHARAVLHGTVPLTIVTEGRAIFRRESVSHSLAVPAAPHTHAAMPKHDVAPPDQSGIGVRHRLVAPPVSQPPAAPVAHPPVAHKPVAQPPAVPPKAPAQTPPKRPQLTHPPQLRVLSPPRAPEQHPSKPHPSMATPAAAPTPAPHETHSKGPKPPPH
ncbi:MAG TPA: DUF6600 domain-containing protein [Rhizomicrobium sp.]|jgi:hypothetical protein